jgi:iron(III) transport system permease protein
MSSTVTDAGLVAAKPRQRLRDGFWVQTVFTVIIVVLLAIVVLPALLQVFLDKPIYYDDVRFTTNNLWRVFNDPEVRASYAATAAFTVILTALSMLLGIAFAILLGRSDLPGKAVLGALLLWPLFISPQIIGFGAIISYGPSGLVTLLWQKMFGAAAPWNIYTVPGIAIISAIASAPVTTLYCIVAARQQDPNYDAAARIAGAGPVHTLKRIALPLMRPALIFALIMNVVHALETLSIPLIVGSPVGIQLITTLIFEKIFASNGPPDYGLVSAMVLVLMLLVLVMFGLQRLALRRSHRFVSISSKAARMKPLALGRAKWPIFGLVWLYVFFAIILLIGSVFLRATTYVVSPFVSISEVLTLQNYIDVLTVDVYLRSITNTMMLAVLGAGLGTLLIAGLALVAQRSDYPLRRYVDVMAQLPRVLPGLIVGLGVFYASVYLPVLGVLRGTIWLLLLAYLIRFISAGYGIISPALYQITTDFDRAAKASGAGWTRTMTHIILPLQKHSLMSCFVLLMILIVKEYASAVFLMAPGSEVIGSTMLSLWLQGQTGPVAALATIQVVITTILIAIATRLFGVKLHD